jgi:hypothetical protein
MHRRNKDLEGGSRVLFKVRPSRSSNHVCLIYLTTFSAALSKFSIRVKSKGVTKKKVQTFSFPSSRNKQQKCYQLPHSLPNADVVTVNSDAFCCSVSSSLVHLSTEL